MTASAQLRACVAQISEAWVARVIRELAPLRALTHDNVIPALVDGLARDLDGEPGFAAIIEAHAAQRLAQGIDLEVAMREYAILRAAILEVVEGSVQLNAALDAAVLVAVQRHVRDRDARLAHDLRNPLNTVTVAADALKHAADPIALEAGEAIADGAKRMRDVLDGLRGRSRS